MSVARAHRGQGVGKALLDAVVAWAPTAGIARVERQVFEASQAASQPYEQRGGTVEGRRRAWVDVGGAKIDVLLMALLVDEQREP